MTPVFQPEALAELFQLEKDGAAGLVQSLLEDYKMTAPASIAAIENAFRLQDCKQIKLTAHSLKSSSKALGLEKMAELCKEIEYAADADKIAADAILSLPRQRDLAIEALNQYILNREKLP